MEEKKENGILDGCVKILKTVTSFGISTVIGNLMMVGMPPHIKWPLKAAVGIGTTILSYMVTDKVGDYIDEKVDETVTEIKDTIAEIQGAAPVPAE